jgi:polyphosphate kinase 2
MLEGEGDVRENPVGYEESGAAERVLAAAQEQPEIVAEAKARDAGENRSMASHGRNSGEDPGRSRNSGRLPRKVYGAELLRLQGELVKLQEWVRTEGVRLVVLFEGRDAAGKGSTIKRVTQYLNPRTARIAALPAPSDRERTRWYFQRYIEHLPSAGEIVLFDRSWYNRAGVERVMGFCTKEEYGRFLHQCPIFERLLIEDGIMLRKYWFSVSDAEQQRRFRDRLDDPMRQWKLSAMDLESITRWEDYSRAKDEMFVHTDIPEAPWYVVDSEDKRRARINMIAHLLGTVPYHGVQRLQLELPTRPSSGGYVRAPRESQTFVPDHAASLGPGHS